MSKQDSIHGLLLGCAVGDSMGLLYEGLSPHRQQKIYPNIAKQSLIFSKGLISDDTEHACMTAYAIYKSKGNKIIFSKTLANSMKKWILTLPYGIGLATLKSSLKLLLAMPVHKSGIFSAGNGPAMRSHIIGLYYGNNLVKMKELIKISTNISHTDPKAEIGALTIGLATYYANRKNKTIPEEFIKATKELLDEFQDNEFIDILNKTIESIQKNESTIEFTNGLGLNKGVSGYMYHTVPVVIHGWLRNQNNYEDAILEIIKCGGDTDTTAAILGSIIGCHVGVEGIPLEWRENIISWPYTQDYIGRLSCVLNGELGNGKENGKESGKESGIERIKEPCLFFVLARNLMVYPVIIFYGVRRLFPPYF